MGTATLLNFLDCIKSFLNTQLEENMEIKLISERRVLLIVNPNTIIGVLY